MTLELKDITGIGRTTAERLQKAGITSVEKLASMKLEDLLKIKGIGRTSAEKYFF